MTRSAPHRALSVAWASIAATSLGAMSATAQTPSPALVPPAPSSSGAAPSASASSNATSATPSPPASAPSSATSATPSSATNAAPSSVASSSSPPEPLASPASSAPRVVADPAKYRITWDEDRPRARWWEYAGTAVSYLAILAIQATPGPKSGLWTGGILLDDDARKWFVLGSPAARDRANNLSDYFTFGPQVFVFADGAASLLYGADLDTAWQIEMMNLEVLGVMGTFTRLGEQYVRRTRPATIACESDPRYESACKAGPYASFPSGHSALAFTAAGLVCAHHTNIPLYGGGLPDYLTCAAGLASAVTSGSLRLMADRHWFSDVIIGTALGLGGGWGLPVLLHYRGGAKHDPAAAYWGIAPTPMPSGAGATMFGLF